MHGSRAHRLINGQSKQPRDGEPHAFPASRAAAARGLDGLLARAEREAALLERAWPENAAAQCQRWLGASQRGEPASLTFCYRRPPVLTELRAALDALAQGGDGALAACFVGLPRAEAIARAYAERAAELSLEAALAEQIGQPGFAALARRRHPVRRDALWAAAERLAREWAGLSLAPTTEELFASDDERAPESLVSIVSALVGQLQLPVRVIVTRALASRAAVGDGVIYVRAGVQLSQRQALRIARHEVFAHAAPRARALAHPIGLARVGCAGAGADEEGRAVLLEQRFGDLDDERRRELGSRHLTALAVAEGADAHDCVRLLAGFECDAARAISLYARCARGAGGSRGALGGLCRELEYLPAWLRVSAAFATEPELELWLEQGRWSLSAARELRPHPRPPHAGA